MRLCKLRNRSPLFCFDNDKEQKECVHATGCQKCQFKVVLVHKYTNTIQWKIYTRQFSADSTQYVLISVVAFYYCFDAAIHAEIPNRVTFSMCEIARGVVRDSDHVTKLKIMKFFPWRVGD